MIRLTIFSILFLLFGVSVPLTSQEKSQDTSKPVIIVTKENLPNKVDSIKNAPRDTISILKDAINAKINVIREQDKEINTLENQKKKSTPKSKKQKTVYVERIITVKDTVYIEKQKEKKGLFKFLKKNKNKKQQNG